MPLAALKESRHRTKHQFVHRTLRDAILKCELRPGDRLVIDDVARRLGVSIIPVREAIRLLQSEGLVVNVPHVGATVAPLSHASIREVFTIMEGLEAVAARAAAENATDADLLAIGHLVAEMDAALLAGQHEHWAELNTRFHLGISRMARMPLLHEMMERILDRWDQVRRFYFSGVLVNRADVAQQEHHALLEQLRSRDLAPLEETIRRHNRGALAAYAAYLESGERAPAAR